METGRLQFIAAEPLKVEKACKGGVRWVQLRVKNKPEAEWLELARQTREICNRFHATFIVNDNLSIALAVKADGVHLGKEDMDPAEARKIAGPDFIIGGTANTIEDIRRLNELKVDYIGLGPFRFTTTKDKLNPILGLSGYRQLMRQCEVEHISIPVVAIGGIQLSDVKGLFETGVYGVAVSSAIGGVADIETTAGNFMMKINECEKNEKRFANHCG